MQWIYSLCLEMVQYIANSLLTVFSMDLDYFFQVAPVAKDILSILIAAGWALLMGNLVFQAVRSMVSGLGFEGEDPKLLFSRTFVFAFLLLASQQICEIGPVSYTHLDVYKRQPFLQQRRGRRGDHQGQCEQDL